MVSPSAHNPLASPFALEIMDFKGAGNGSPAMPSSHPNYRAYTGLEYKRRVAVRGGSWPYTYELSGQPSGMAIDASGYITWSNPTAGTHSDIVLTVSDAAEDEVQATFSVVVGTSGFHFLDGSFEGTSTGSITQPWKTLNDAVVGMQGSPTAILYIRAGTYTFTTYSFDGTYASRDGPGDDGDEGSATDGGSLYVNIGATTAGENWIAYPGESPVIDLGGTMMLRTTKPYMQGLTFTSGREYVWRFSGASNYWKFLDCEFDGVEGATSVNNNQGFTFAQNDGDGYYGSMQGNEGHDFEGAQAFGSFYYTHKVLIEDNHIYDGGWDGRHGFATSIGLKVGCEDATIRANLIQIPDGAVVGLEVYNYPGGVVTDISYNTILDARSSGSALRFVEVGQDGVYVFRNSIDGNVDFDVDHTNLQFYKNAVEGNFIDSAFATLSDNIQATSGVLDASGNLEAAYAEYVGSVGAQIP